MRKKSDPIGGGITFGGIVIIICLRSIGGFSMLESIGIFLAIILGMSGLIALIWGYIFFVGRLKEKKVLKTLQIAENIDDVWHEENIKERVSAIYVKVKEARSKQDISNLTEYITEKENNRLKTLLSEIKKLKIEEHFEEIEIEKVGFLGVQAFKDNREDSLIVSITVNVKKYKVHKSSKTIIEGTEEYQTKSYEKWRLIRIENRWLLDENITDNKEIDKLKYLFD